MADAYNFTKPLADYFRETYDASNGSGGDMPWGPYDQWLASQLGWTGIDPKSDLSGINYTSAFDPASNLYRETVADSSGKQLADRQYAPEKWNFLSDVLLPSLAVVGGGYGLFNGIGSLAGGAAAGSAGGSAAGAAAAEGAAGASAGAAAGSGSLAAADAGLTALGSSMSPQALGLTAITPGTTAAELAALSSGIPSLAPSLTDLALQGAMRGAVTGGVKGLVTGQNPLQSALSGAVGGGLTGEHCRHDTSRLMGADKRHCFFRYCQAAQSFLRRPQLQHCASEHAVKMSSADAYPDAVGNMQWLTVEAHKEKTAREAGECRAKRY